MGSRPPSGKFNVSKEKHLCLNLWGHHGIEAAPEHFAPDGDNPAGGGGVWKASHTSC